jgi:hypothetical protein
MARHTAWAWASSVKRAPSTLSFPASISGVLWLVTEPTVSPADSMTVLTSEAHGSAPGTSGL